MRVCRKLLKIKLTVSTGFIHQILHFRVIITRVTTTKVIISGVTHGLEDQEAEAEIIEVDSEVEATMIKLIQSL